MSDETLLETVRAYQDFGSLRDAAKYLGVHNGTVSRRLAKAHALGITDIAPGEDFKVTTGAEKASIWSVNDAVRTVDQAIEKAGFDLSVWRVHRGTAQQIPTSMKLAEGSKKEGTYTEKPHKEYGWLVKVEMVRRAPKWLTDGLELIHERMEKFKPAYRKMPDRKPPADPHMFELDLFDLHFGKLAWAPETGENYDLAIAESLFERAARYLLGYTKGLAIDKIVIPLGNDFLHVDNPKLETYAGTTMDVEGRYAKILNTAFWALVNVGALAARIAPVEWVLARGNHDYTSVYHLARELQAHYRGTPMEDRVKVDTSVQHRKYLQYGTTLLGYTHGNEEKHSALPGLMATEAKEKWAATEHHEWHLGHFHKKKQMSFVPVESHEGVIVRTLGALTGRDAWHSLKGYVGDRAAEAYLWSRDRGYVGHWSVDARNL